MTLPEYQKRDILKLYFVAVDELGTYRRDAVFKKLVKSCCFPHYSRKELNEAYTLVREYETLRENGQTVDALKDEFASDVIRLFGKWDKDDDGLISLKEFAEAMDGIMESEDVNKCFGIMDVNGDGELDVVEIFNFLKANPDWTFKFDKAFRQIRKLADAQEKDRLNSLFKRIPEQDERPNLSHVRPWEEQIEYLRRSKYLS